VKPIIWPHSFFTYHLSGGTAENDLPCIRNLRAGTVTSRWVFDDDSEAMSLLDGGKLCLAVWGDAHIDANLVGDLRISDSIKPLAAMLIESPERLWEVELSELDREDLLAGGAIELIVHAVPPPAMSVWVSEPMEA